MPSSTGRRCGMWTASRCSCTERESRAPAMSVFVLIHGSWHGGWCWERVTPLLRAAGHRVIAPDLPGHGHDAPPVERAYERYVPFVCGLLDAQPEPVVLVGHSSGGM